MAKLQMKRIRLLALRKDRKPLMEKLQRLGAVEIEAEEQPPDGFDRLDMDAQAQGFERSAQTARQALDYLKERLPEKQGLLAALSGRREVSEEELDAAAGKSTAVMKDCQRVLTIQRQLAEEAAERVRLRAAAAQLEAWEGLDVSFRFSGTRSTADFIGTLTGLFTLESLAAALAESNERLLFDGEVLSAAQEQTCVFLLCPKRQAAAMEQALRALGFARPAGASSQLPAEEKRRLEDKLTALRTREAEMARELEALAEKRRDMELVADYFTARADKYRAIGALGHSRHAFLLTGWIPAVDIPLVQRQLEALCPCVLETEDGDPEEAPVKLYNNAFAAPAESITEMYAMPLPSDIDPTPVVSFFYYLFFGMMLSDAGYGLLLVLGAAFLLRKCRPEEAMARNLRLFRNCGVSTILWGLVFGSFFGNAPETIAKTFFHIDWTMPKLIDPIPDAVMLLVLGVGLGFVQILTGMGVKFYMQWRAGDRLGAVFDTGFWMTALVGFALLAGGMALPAAAVLVKVGGGLAAVSLLGLVLTQGRKKKGPMKVLSGVASLYDVTSYVSDLMSYSRLMALGLTTGVMGMVFNLLGSMFGGGIAGLIPFAVIFLVGHTLNLGINALGAYVHTLRLQYVELFSKFYEGGGRAFQPFAYRSQYVRLHKEA